MNLTFKYLIIGLIIVLVAGIMLLATQVWNPSWNPFKGIEKQIIEKAIEHTLQAKTYGFEEKIGVKTEKEEGGNLDIKGVVDRSEIENVKTDSSVKIELTVQNVKIQGTGEIKTLEGEKAIYLKLINLPPLPFLSKEILEGIKEQWVKIDIKKFEEISGKMSETSIAEQKVFLEEIKKLVKDKQFFEIKKKNSENLDGIKTIHYLVVPNKKTIKEVVPEFLELGAKYTKVQREEAEKEIEKALKNFEENFDEFWRKVSPLEFDFWVEKDIWVRRIKFEKEFDLDKLRMEGLIPITESATGTEKKLEGKLNVSLDIKFFDFNKELKIEMPENYKTIEEIYSSFLMPFSSETPSLPSLPGLTPETKIPDFSLPDLPLPE